MYFYLYFRIESDSVCMLKKYRRLFENSKHITLWIWNNDTSQFPHHYNSVLDQVTCFFLLRINYGGLVCLLVWLVVAQKKEIPGSGSLLLIQHTVGMDLK